MSALGRGVLVINSQRVAVDLLEKRSNIYSDRPTFVCAGDILTRNLDLAMTPFGDLYAVLPILTFSLQNADHFINRYRRLRRVAVEGFSKSVVPDFYPIQSREALILALALMKNPSYPEKHLQRHASSIILSINYHFPPVDSEDDTVVVGVVKHVERMMHEMQPGARLVEFLTWMRYIPSR